MGSLGTQNTAVYPPGSTNNKFASDKNQVYQVARLTSKSPQNATSAIRKVIFHTVYTKKYISSSTNELLKPPLLNAKTKQTAMQENSD